MEDDEGDWGDEWEGDDGDDDEGGWSDDDLPDDDEGGPEIDVQIDNLFYEADDLRRHEPKAALEKFEECVELEKKEKGDEIQKRFQGLEHIVALHFQFGDLDKMIVRYKELLSYTNKVTRNESAESINNILNKVSDSQDFTFLNELYQVTLEALKAIPGQERVYFNISMKLCKIQLEKECYDDTRKLLQQMHDTCTLPDGSDDPSKGGQLLEIYAVEIQLMTRVGDSVRLKELFEKTKILNSEINDPRSMSIIRECWGKMFAGIDKWADAYSEFYAAFLQYQEIGHFKAKQCLKYVVVANMLSQNESNPFDAREAKVYESDPEIEAMVNLRSSYDNDDIRQFEKILRVNSGTITNDPFIKNHVDALLYRIRSRACVNLIKPYKRIHIKYLARRLNISNDDVESLVVNLILDEVIAGKLDQINGLLDLSLRSTESVAKYNAIDEWSHNLGVLSSNITARAATGPPDRSAIGPGAFGGAPEKHEIGGMFQDIGMGVFQGVKGALGF